MPRFNKSKLMKRSLSAVVLAPMTLVIIFAGGWPFAAFVVLAFMLTFSEWRQMVMKLSPSFLFVILGFVYLLIGCGSFYVLREEFTFEAAMFFIILVWASDTGAYFAGKFVGGPRMAVRISPNKTWAGFAGATVMPALIAMMWLSFKEYKYESELSVLLLYAGAVLIGLATGVVGQAGDLLISLIKRKSGVKDTGHLIPGHGGLLDRIDSLLPNAPLFLLIAYTVRHAG